MHTEPRGALKSLMILMAEMRSEPLEPEPDSTGVGMVTLIAFHSVSLRFTVSLCDSYDDTVC